MRIRTGVLLAILAVACSKKDEPSAAKSAAPVSSSSVSGASVPGASFVPGSILSQLGASRIVVAVDFTKLDLKGKLKQLVPEHLACVREVLGSTGIAVFGMGDAAAGVVTKLPARATKQCMATLGISSVASAGGVDQFDAGDRRVSLAWQGDLAIIKEVGKETSGTLSTEMRRRIEGLPPSAFAWMVVDGWEPWAKQVKRASVWLDVSDTELGISGTLDGTESASAKEWADAFVRGLRKSLVAGGLPVEDSWFNASSTETTASFAVKVPLRVLLNR